MTEISKAELLDMAVDIVTAYVSHNDVKAGDLPKLIEQVYGSVSRAFLCPKRADTAPRPEPAVPIDESLTDEAIICLEDGQSFQSLRAPFTC